MRTIRLVSWNEDVAKMRAELLQKPGFTIDASAFDPAGMIGRLRANPPSAMVIDLDRLPSRGREVAVAIRGSKSIRDIPILFAGGSSEKVERVRAELPDATFTSWNRARSALAKALKNRPVDLVSPVEHMQRYAGSPLAKKLGIKPGISVALLGAVPDNLEALIGELPEGSTFNARSTSALTLTIWFVRSQEELSFAAENLAARLMRGGAGWIAFPKKASRHRVDFNQHDVRAAGAACGLVDYKVCAVDAEWSAYKFAPRKK